ncbi:MAG: twin-arginine translocase TatA/TatE family subunit [Deltaproteobacteria bacterium]|jgi:sec-independent protein translocase protein TatA|nr:twin-arginine translocase TatA/TatE family subunit [Deltaproteobacteria bacterium]
MGRLGTWEILIIVILVAVIFGGRRLPELGRYLGKGLSNFRSAVKEDDKKTPTEEEKPKNDADSPR